MNLILFEPDEMVRPLPRGDPRAEHLLRVLGRREGDTFDAGLVNGPRGKGTLIAVGTEALTLSFAWGAELPPPAPITLIVGLPRPQTARDILRDATSLGVAAMHFVTTDKGESSYQRSALWTTGEWRRHLLLGAQQAFDTRLPEVTCGRTLLEAVGRLSERAVRVALDHYEAPVAFTRCRLTADPAPAAPPDVVLAFGPERGWSNTERATLRGAGFALAHLGARVLRTETAVAAAVTLARAQLGLL